jgi:hypothetical protein
VIVQIRDGKLVNESEIVRMKEPRGIDMDPQGNLAIAAENVIYIFDGQKTYKRRDPWFSYIHTVKFSPHYPTRMLIASSGLDKIIEMDYRTGEITWEWLAWDNGFNVGHDHETNSEILLTASADEAAYYKGKGRHFKWIEDPASEVLPTAMRAAFINSIGYHPDKDQFIYATFFHEGKVFEIDRKSGAAKPVMEGLKNPHGGTAFKGGILATSTAAGEVIWTKSEQTQVYDFTMLSGKDPDLGSLEWLQNTAAIHDILVTIDSNRTRFTIYPVSAEWVCHVPYNENWAVQDLIICPVEPLGLDRLAKM